ncbi:hypothetical protein [Paraburkholderia sp. BL10I2N1]|nr:hypothetical protein [Paraburkholderia sp. BL10I2N1]TDN69090.1 hypothetical protein B0G77_2459 [Paraburkholderia sp. BL10I2N1]
MSQETKQQEGVQGPKAGSQPVTQYSGGGHAHSIKVSENQSLPHNKQSQQ